VGLDRDEHEIILSLIKTSLLFAYPLSAVGEFCFHIKWSNSSFKLKNRKLSKAAKINLSNPKKAFSLGII